MALTENGISANTVCIPRCMNRNGMPMPIMMTEIQEQIKTNILISLEAWMMPAKIMIDARTPSAFSIFVANGTLVMVAKL